MVNACQMHYGCSYKEQDWQFLCILFHPSLFGSNKPLLQKYVTPVIENTSCEYLHFQSGQTRGQEIAKVALSSLNGMKVRFLKQVRILLTVMLLAKDGSSEWLVSSPII